MNKLKKLFLFFVMLMGLWCMMGCSVGANTPQKSKIYIELTCSKDLKGEYATLALDAVIKAIENSNSKLEEDQIIELCGSVVEASGKKTSASCKREDNTYKITFGSGDGKTIKESVIVG